MVCITVGYDTQSHTAVEPSHPAEAQQHHPHRSQPCPCFLQSVPQDTQVTQDKAKLLHNVVGEAAFIRLMNTVCLCWVVKPWTTGKMEIRDNLCEAAHPKPVGCVSGCSERGEAQPPRGIVSPEETQHQGSLSRNIRGTGVTRAAVQVVILLFKHMDQILL